jgi:hypothetical protein
VLPGAPQKGNMVGCACTAKGLNNSLDRTMNIVACVFLTTVPRCMSSQHMLEHVGVSSSTDLSSCAPLHPLTHHYLLLLLLLLLLL